MRVHPHLSVGSVSVARRVRRVGAAGRPSEASERGKSAEEQRRKSSRPTAAGSAIDPVSRRDRELLLCAGDFREVGSAGGVVRPDTDHPDSHLSYQAACICKLIR